MNHQSALNERGTYNERKQPNLFRQQYDKVLKQKFYLLSKEQDADTMMYLAEVQSKLMQLDRLASEQSNKSIISHK